LDSACQVLRILCNYVSVNNIMGLRHNVKAWCEATFHLDVDDEDIVWSLAWRRILIALLSELAVTKYSYILVINICGIYFIHLFMSGEIW